MFSRFHSGQSFSLSPVEQIVDIPVPSGGLHDSLPDPGASSAVARDELEKGGFRTFFSWKKCGGGWVAEHGAEWARQLIHAERSSSTWIADNEDTWQMVHSVRLGVYWVNTIIYDTQWHPPWEHFPGQGPPPAQGGISVLGTAAVGAAQPTFLGSCSDLFQQFSDRRWCNCAENRRVFPVAVREYSSLRNAWFDSGYMLCDSSRVLVDVFSRIFNVKVEPRMLKSVSSSSPAVVWRSVHSRRFSLTRRLHGEIWDYFQAFPQKQIFWEPSVTHSCELLRARGGWRGRQESRLPGDLPPISLTDCRCNSGCDHTRRLPQSASGTATTIVQSGEAPF